MQEWAGAKPHASCPSTHARTLR